MVESFLKGQKTLWEKEKLLVTSNFSFSHRVFKRLELQTRKNQGLFRKGLNLYHTIRLLKNVGMKGFKNIVGKGEKAGNQHYLLFPQGFLPFRTQISIFE